jgi:16S rRNA (guanine1207-N2)-methyltransferase
VSSEQYFEPQPTSASQRRSIGLDLPDVSLRLATDTGVFSGDRVDRGTKYLLLDGPPPPASGDLLDLGCGYGPIAVTLARRAPRATVWAVDVNERAVALCAENARANGCPNVRAGSPDGVPEAVRFAAIYSNPPVRIGNPALHAMLLRWLARLRPDGHAYLVVHKHLGSDSLARWLTAQGYRVDRLGSRQGYRILDVSPPLEVVGG